MGASSAEARRIKPNHAADHVLVRFKPGVPPSWRGIAHAAVQAQVLRDYSTIEGLQLVKLPPGLSVEEAIGRYREQPEVLYAEPDYLIYPTATPNDTSFGQLWGLNNTGQSVNGTFGLNDADIDAPEAWDITTGNSNLVIATIDTGIAYNHPDLAANMVQLESNCSDGVDNDLNGFKDDCRGIDAVGGISSQCNNNPEQCFGSTDPIDTDNEIVSGDAIRHHGTRVAGVIGAVGNNGTGVTGVNWNIKLLACKALSGATGPALVNLVSDAIQCLNYVIATKNVHPELTFVATNNSWATVNFSQGLLDAIDVQRQNGILFVAAADNSASSNDFAPIFPASYYLPNVISVAATNQSDSLASFSNFGRRTVHLGAPGANILSTVRTGLASTNDTTCDVSQAYCLGNGTSFSAPYVSGVAALVKAKLILDGVAGPNDWIKIKNLILAGGDNKPTLSSTTITGKRLNAHGALTCSNQVVNQRLQPVANMLTVAVGTQITLASLNINCAAANGNVLVDVKNPANQVVQTVTLQDNGNAPDQVAGDAIFSGTFIPSTADTMSLVFPGNDIVTVRIIQGYSCTTPSPNGGCTSGAVSFNYRNIAGPGEHNLDLDDDSSASIAPPFQLQFGNLTFNTVTVNANGNLSLTGTPGGPDNAALPDAFEDTLVAPWWDDLKPLPNTQQNVFWRVTGATPTRELVIEWRDLPHFGSGTENCPTTETVKFQVVLFESSNDILFNYADTVFGATCQSILSVNNGASATIGVQVAPATAKQFSFNSAQLAGNKAILWQLGNNPAPTLNSMSPTSKLAGSPGFTLTVNGLNFVPTSIVKWNGSNRTTNFVNSGQLTATITVADIANPGTAQVTVFNPSPGGGTSAALTFTIVTPPPPVLTSISPNSTLIGGPQFTLTANGSNFLPSSVVRWNGADRSTLFGSDTQLTATIPASDVATAGTVTVTVFSPAPGGGTSNSQTFTVNNPVPTLTSISPTTAGAGGPQFTLTVNGSNFISSSVVRWNGSNRTTTFVNSGQLTAVIPAGDISVGGTFPVTVSTPGPGGGVTSPQTFTVTNPAPTLTNTSPTNATAGGVDFTLTVNGSNFVSTSVIRWNGNNRTTTFISSTQLRATIPAGDITTAGTALVTVFSPTPGGGTTSSQTFTINNPLPVLNNISPTNAQAGGAQFTLTVNGSGFVNGSVVRWNGVDRTTTFVNSGQLTATIPVSDIATAGTATVTVSTPTPGGGASAGQTFTINNPLPVLNSISPTNAQAGGAQFTLTVNGSSFANGAVVRWNGSDRTTVFVTAGQLTATIPASDIAVGGTPQVTVFNPGPGGGTSAGQTFTISNPAPTLLSLSPTNATAGGAQFTLTVNGSSFVSTSVVRWNGSDRATAFVNSGQLTATIPASDITSAGPATVTVFTPTPGGGTSGGQTVTVNNPVPVLNNLSPTSATAGGAQFTLTVNGASFVNGSVVRWNGSDRVTTFVNSGQLTVTIPASDIATAGTVQVTVFNPVPGGGTSGVQTFTVNNPLSVLNNISPTNAQAGGAGFTLTVNGSNFAGTSKVRWNGSDRGTVFVNSGQLTATIPAGDIAAAGTAQVAVFSPTPGGGTSGTQTFTINNPGPAINSLNPGSAVAGGVGFTLTVNGTGFVSGSVVRWNGSNRTTTFVNSTQLTAAIAAGDIASVGSASVTVFNPAPGGGSSLASTFTINAPPPVVLDSIQPASAVAGGTGFTLTVNGQNFLSTSVVRWNGADRTTTFVNSGQLTATIPPSDIFAAGTAQVAVFTPAPVNGVSNALTFSINNPLPVLNNIAPTNTQAGGAGFTLTVNGSSFVSSSVVRWNGVARTTTFVNSGQLTAAISAGDIATAGTAQVTVFTPAPGGGVSGEQTFTINNPLPVLNNIVPSSTVLGGAGFTLTVNGSSFVAGSVVRWNGVARTTTFVNSGQLTAAIPASDIVAAGTAQVTVFTPTPGGGVSGPQAFTINNPAPSLNSMSPAGAVAGGSGFTLTTNGSNLVAGSVVRWNGVDRVTTFVNSTQLTAAIPAGDIGAAGTAQVTVFTAGPGGGTSAPLTFTISSPPVVLTSIVPSSAIAGGAGFTLTVNGSNFINGSSVVQWNGVNRTTTFVNSGQVTATIPAGDIASAGTAQVTVLTSGQLSNGLTFNINNPLPALNNISPTNTGVGGAGFTLMANGSVFVNGSVVRWNGSDRPTTFVSGGQLTAAIPASDLAGAGTAQVTVFTAAPGGGASAAQVFTINNPLPVLSSISPTNTVVGGAGFMLTVNGSGFVSGSVVRWNGSDRTTMFVNGGQLTAAIPASDIASTGMASVTVFSPGPGGGTSGAQTFTINNPVPLTNSMSPSSAVAPGIGFTLTVSGSSFVNGSVVRWNGVDRTTTFVNSTQLTAAIPAGDVATAGTAQVTVFTGAPGGGTSTPLLFTINTPPPVTTTSIAPSSAVAGGAGFTLTVNGTNFSAGSVVRWNGADRTTTFVNAGQLTATIPASDITTASTAQVTVFTSGPSTCNCTSNSQTFTINNPLPVLSNISPSSVLAGDGAFTLTVNGSNFINGSAVRWNGSNRTTTFVNSGQLTAAIPASDIASVGTAQVTVFTPSPGGGTSAAQTFAINHPLPVLNSIVPTTAVAGGPAFMLTVNGQNFVNGLSVVRWNGTDRVTAFVNAGQLTATIPDGDIATAGTAQVTVFTTGSGTSNSQAFAINNPVPAVGALVPASAVAGGAGFMLTVNGSSFVNGAVVRWNGIDRTTTFVNGIQLTATIPASDIATAGTASVTAFNPAPGGGVSSAQTFTINNPVPTLAGIVPTNTLAGGAQFTLTLNGSGFVNGSVVRWNGASRATTFVNSGQLTATILAEDIAAGGTAQITVFNATPGGGTSGVQTFTVNNPVPTLVSALPSSAPVGTAGLTVTVNGSGFVPNSVVQWNGGNRTTAFVNANQVQATIPAGDTVNAGAAVVRVVNPAPGGGTSAGANITLLSPFITDVQPNTVPATSPTFDLIVNGMNFHPGSVVRWKGIDRATMFMSPTQLKATILASDVAVPGSATVTVFNSPGTGGASTGVSVTVSSRNPFPTITGLLPAGVTQGSGAFTLTVVGSNFVSNSVVRWNGSNRTTVFLSSGILQASIPASDILSAGTATITVFTPTPGGGLSNGLGFPIQSMNNPPPTTSALMPASVVAGSVRTSLVLVVIGANFVPGSVVRWNGMDRATVFGSSNQLTATIPASDVAAVGMAPVTVFTPGPGGGVSNAQTFTVNNPVPSLSSLSPGTAVAGSAGFTLVVVGSNFVPGSVVHWNGFPRLTTYVGNSQLRAAIPASDLTSAGTKPVTVFNPAPGGGFSTPLNFGVTVSGSSTTSSAGTSGGSGDAAPPSSPSGSEALPSSTTSEEKLSTQQVGSESSPGVGWVIGGSGAAEEAVRPEVESLSPESVTAGSAGFTLIVRGKNFLPGAVIRWNGADLATIYVGSDELRATVPPERLAAAGVFKITVFNPDPPGGESEAAEFTVQ